MMEQNEPKMSTARKIGVGAALVALPLGVYQVLRQLAFAAESTTPGAEKAYRYDTAALKQVDPKLVRYHELARIEPGLDSPTAVAVTPSGEILVAGNGVIRRLSASGAILRNIPISGEAYAVAAAGDGTLYAAHKDHVEVIGPDGQTRSTWATLGSDSYLTSVAVGESGVYVADAGRRVVIRYSAEGKVLNEIGRRDDGRKIPGLVVPSPHLDVVIGIEGLIWVANPGMHRLEAYTPDGNLEAFWGGPGTAIDKFFGCCNPADLAMLADGSFITAEKGLPRVKRYTPDGRFDSIVAPPDLFGDNRQGIDIATNLKGEILVLERGTKTIRVFAPKKEGA